MSRLVDAEKLCEYARNLVSRSVDANDIMRFPRVDAEPVRHGHWIDTNEGTYCSECRNYPYDDGEFHILHWRSDYCPNCGAKMDEV